MKKKTKTLWWEVVDTFNHFWVFYFIGILFMLMFSPASQVWSLVLSPFYIFTIIMLSLILKGVELLTDKLKGK